MLCSFYTNARVSSKGKNSSPADVNFSCDSHREKILSQIFNQISVIITYGVYYFEWLQISLNSS